MDQTMTHAEMKKAGEMGLLAAVEAETRERIEEEVNHPKHYNSHPSGIEVIQIVEHMNFCLGNAVKYILRCDYKEDDIKDLRKAIWYLEREIKRRLGGDDNERT